MVETEAGADVIRFMIVDDSRAIQAILHRIVERCGYPAVEIKSASNGAAALEVMDSYTPDMVITDWHMPKMSGLELLQTMRQMGKHDIPVGLVTTETSPDMLGSASRNGAVFVLNKPFKDDELISLLLKTVPPHRKPAETLPPKQPEKPAGDTGLVSMEACRQLTQSTMSGIPFRLLANPPLSKGDLSAKNMIGLYSAPNKSISAIAVLDMNAICILGGGSTRQPPVIVREAMRSGEATEDMVKHAKEFLASAGTIIRIPGDPAQVQLSRFSLVPQGFQKLNELLGKNSGRADFRVSVPGYGDGRLSFLAV